jgi:hypothetical protein
MRRYRTDDEFPSAKRSRESAEVTTGRTDITTVLEKAPPRLRHGQAAPTGATILRSGIKLATFGKSRGLFPFLYSRIFDPMNNKQKNVRNGPGTSKGKQQAKVGISALHRLERYAVLGLELSQRIYEKLEHVEDSIEILARQKARELNQKKSATKKD